jgi:hypothetical protein
MTRDMTRITDALSVRYSWLFVKDKVAVNLVISWSFVTNKVSVTLITSLPIFDSKRYLMITDAFSVTNDQGYD